MKRNGQQNNLIEQTYYIEEEYEKMLGGLSALTGKDQTLLVNEAIGDLIDRFKPKAKNNLIRLRTSKK